VQPRRIDLDRAAHARIQLQRAALEPRQLDARDESIGRWTAPGAPPTRALARKPVPGTCVCGLPTTAARADTIATTSAVRGARHWARVPRASS